MSYARNSLFLHISVYIFSLWKIIKIWFSARKTIRADGTDTWIGCQTIVYQRQPSIIKPLGKVAAGWQAGEKMGEQGLNPCSDEGKVFIAISRFVEHRPRRRSADRGGSPSRRGETRNSVVRSPVLRQQCSNIACIHTERYTRCYCNCFVCACCTLYCPMHWLRRKQYYCRKVYELRNEYSYACYFVTSHYCWSYLEDFNRDYL